MAYLACLCGSPDVSDVEMSGNQSQNVIGQTVRVVLSVSNRGALQIEHRKRIVEQILSLVVAAVAVAISLLFLGRFRTHEDRKRVWPAGTAIWGESCTHRLSEWWQRTEGSL